MYRAQLKPYWFFNKKREKQKAQKLGYVRLVLEDLWRAFRFFNVTRKTDSTCSNDRTCGDKSFSTRMFLRKKLQSFAKNFGGCTLLSIGNRYLKLFSNLIKPLLYLVFGRAKKCASFEKRKVPKVRIVTNPTTGSLETFCKSECHSQKGWACSPTRGPTETVTYLSPCSFAKNLLGSKCRLFQWASKAAVYYLKNYRVVVVYLGRHLCLLLETAMTSCRTNFGACNAT